METWQRPCTCGHEVYGFTVCSTCTGAAVRVPDAGTGNSLCRWCRQECPRDCTACGNGIHLRGECHLWNHGANRIYAASPSWDRHLCPDCVWQWVRTLAASRPSNPTPLVASDVMAYLEDSAAHPCPGAGGQGNAQRRSVPSERRAYRWVMRRVRNGAWHAVASLGESFHAVLSTGDMRPDPVPCRAAIVEAVRRLIANAQLQRRGHGATMQVRKGLPCRHVRTARRRRRPSADSLDEQRPAARRRLT